MSGQLGHVEVATNGKRNVTGAEPLEHPHEAPPSLAGQSAEERLNELMETIQAWDWRTAPVKAEQPACTETAATVSALRATAPAEVREEPFDVRREPFEVRREPFEVRREPFEVRHESAPVHEAFEPLTDDPALLQCTQNVPLVEHEQLHPPVTVMSFGPGEPDGSGHVNSEPLPWPEPEPEPTAEASPIRRLWSQSWTHTVVLCLVAVAAVLLIIWSIRLAHNGPVSGTPSTTTVTQPASRPASAANASHTSFVAPIASAPLTRYKLYARGLQQANATATRAFVSAGSTPTPTQLAATVTAYRAAVNLYDFQLRFIQWPASMQAAITVDHAQLEALVSYLQSFSAISPIDISTWLSGLHNRDASTQAADNQVRHDLGLPSTSSFP